MKYYVLRERYDGMFEPTGADIELAPDATIEAVLALIAETGLRHAVWPYEPMRREPAPSEHIDAHAVPASVGEPPASVGEPPASVAEPPASVGEPPAAPHEES